MNPGIAFYEFELISSDERVDWRYTMASEINMQLNSGTWNLCRLDAICAAIAIAYEENPGKTAKELIKEISEVGCT